VWESDYSPNFTAKVHGDHVAELSEYLKDRAEQQKIDSLTTQEPEKYGWLKRDIDWHRTACLGNSRERSHVGVQKHAGKARRNAFATKDVRWQRKDNAFMQEKMYHNIKVSDNICDMCRQLEDEPQVETKEHYLVCKAHKKTRTATDKKVLEEIHKFTSRTVKELPNFWNADTTGQFPAGTLKAEVAKFTAQDAARGLVPTPWVKYLRTLPWKHGTDLEEVVSRCQVALVNGFWRCWRDRCDTFHKLHKPSTEPPQT